MLYITRQEALNAGLTHEGTLFGVPAYLAITSDYVVSGTPKVPVLVLWCMFADALYELASYFLRGHQVLQSPIRIERRIG